MPNLKNSREYFEYVRKILGFTLLQRLVSGFHGFLFP